MSEHDEAEVGTVIGVHCRRCDEIWHYDDAGDIGCRCQVGKSAWGLRRHIRRNWEPVRQGSMSQFVGMTARCFCGADLGMAELPGDATAAIVEHFREVHPEMGVDE